MIKKYTIILINKKNNIVYIGFDLIKVEIE